MGPMLVAILAVLFLAFAALSACLGIVFSVLGFRRVLAQSSPIFGICVIVSGVLGAVLSVLLGLAMQENIVGDLIMKNKIVGCTAWAAVGFVWSAAAAFLVGCLVRKRPHDDSAA